MFSTNPVPEKVLLNVLGRGWVLFLRMLAVRTIIRAAASSTIVKTKGLESFMMSGNILSLSKEFHAKIRVFTIFA